MISSATTALVPATSVPTSVVGGGEVLPQSQTSLREDQVVPAATAAQNTAGDQEQPFLSLSSDLLSALQGEEEAADQEAASPEKTGSSDQKSAKDIADETGLTPEEEAVVKNLKERDQEVRTHEQAHAAVGGQYAGSPSYEYETGPDNHRYAVAGEVKIDTAPVPGDPSATIDKMDVVIKAALAPAEPSSQDRAVAAQAAQKRLEAQAELNAQKQAERTGEAEDGAETAPAGNSGSAPEAPIVNLIA